MSKIRVWHSSRDPYHCIFRLLRILLAMESNWIEIERLRILDLYLLFPSLLHHSSMPQDVREHFNTLSVPSPTNIFMRLPSAAAASQDLRIYQDAAISSLVARSMLKKESIRKSVAELRRNQVPDLLWGRAVSKNETDGGLVDFLTRSFATMPLIGSNSIYRRASLPPRRFAP
jgi:hypothetical protein